LRAHAVGVARRESIIAETSAASSRSGRADAAHAIGRIRRPTRTPRADRADRAELGATREALGATREALGAIRAALGATRGTAATRAELGPARALRAEPGATERDDIADSIPPLFAAPPGTAAAAPVASGTSEPSVKNLLIYF
jgi:hypothetical protein